MTLTLGPNLPRRRVRPATESVSYPGSPPSPNTSEGSGGPEVSGLSFLVPSRTRHVDVCLRLVGLFSSVFRETRRKVPREVRGPESTVRPKAKSNRRGDFTRQPQPSPKTSTVLDPTTHSFRESCSCPNRVFFSGDLRTDSVTGID